MGEFGFTVTLEGWFIGLGGESQGIEKTNWGKGTWDGVDGEGGGRSGEESKGGNGRFHLDSWGSWGWMDLCERFDGNGFPIYVRINKKK